MTTTTAPRLLSDHFWPRPSDHTLSLLRTATLVLGFALLTGALAQFELTLGFTPVPITGQTLGVLLSGGALGWRAGGASQLLYWLLGLAGVPLYAGGQGGWANGTGATFGYFAGFVVASAIIGYLAERHHDRNIASSLSAMALGSIVIYVFGAGWLAHALDVPVATGTTNALSLGVVPFLIGDVIKLVLAGALLPVTWAIVRDDR